VIETGRAPSRARWTVWLPEQGLRVQVDPALTLLEALRQAGLPLRHACRNGVCEICTAHLLSGRVEQRYPQGMIEGRAQDAPAVLLCTAKAAGDLVLTLAPWACKHD
jgi:ferredoxin